MNTLITLLIIVAYFVINFIVARMMENAAAMKGHGSEAHAFAACFWLGIIGCVYVAALPDKIAQGQNQQIIDLLQKEANK